MTLGYDYEDYEEFDPYGEPRTEKEEEPEANPWPSYRASSKTGTITVETTESGLPMGVRIEARELTMDPDQLAGEILRLCRRAANRAGLERRKQLEEAGWSQASLERAGLPTEAELARQEIVEEQDYDTEPQSWLDTL